MKFQEPCMQGSNDAGNIKSVMDGSNMPPQCFSKLGNKSIKLIPSKSIWRVFLLEQVNLGAS